MFISRELKLTILSFTLVTGLAPHALLAQSDSDAVVFIESPANVLDEYYDGTFIATWHYAAPSHGSPGEFLPPSSLNGFITGPPSVAWIDPAGGYNVWTGGEDLIEPVLTPTTGLGAAAPVEPNGHTVDGLSCSLYLAASGTLLPVSSIQFDDVTVTDASPTVALTGMALVGLALMRRCLSPVTRAT